MADDRPVEDPVDQVGRLQRELDDFRSTVLARLTRRATGDVEPTVRVTPKANTLIMNGQLVSRTDYPDLWAWATEAGIVIAGLFTAGDGSTTFGLPDFRGRVPVGVGTLGSDAYALGGLVGASTKVLTTANLPAHKHNVSVANHDNHSHGGNAQPGGNHGGHHASQVLVAAGPDYGVTTNVSANSGDHGHGMNIDFNPVSAHQVTESNIGSGTALDVRQASIAINWLVWT